MTGPARMRNPDEAMQDLLAELQPVSTTRVALTKSPGRVLAESIRADRDSPACDVSQMDGYAVRRADLGPGRLAVAGECVIGQPPAELPPGRTLAIYTGAPIPAGAEAVIPREDVNEQPGQIVIPPDHRTPEIGRFIRRQGENLRAGESAIDEGTLITSAVVATLASFGVARPRVFDRVRVGLIVTGNELLDVDQSPAAWQIRDSNGPTLFGLLSACPWLAVEAPVHVPDEPDRLRAVLAAQLEQADGVFMTGGVSMGRYDHVPGVVADVGARIVFHKLPIRPGKPVLAAVGPNGQVIFGLPGNPVSALVTARRLGTMALRRRAGWRTPAPAAAQVELIHPDGKQLALSWFRPVRITGPGRAELVPTRGSGDVVSAGRSDGFVEVSPSATGAGPWPFYRWEI